MSELDKLIPALLAAQSEFPPIRFDARNEHFCNRYATLAHLIAETRPALAKNGLAVSQLVDGDSVVTLLLHVSGQQLSGRTPIVTDKAGPQAMGSGITYARRYGLCAILGVAAEDDDDGEAAQQRPAPPQKPAAPRAQQAAKPVPMPPPKPSEGEPAWFAETLKGGKHAGKSWRDIASGSVGGQRHEWCHWVVTKAEKVTAETKERAAYVLALYDASEAAEQQRGLERF